VKLLFRRIAAGWRRSSRRGGEADLDQELREYLNAAVDERSLPG
jgi:hypothetical protein